MEKIAIPSDQRRARVVFLYIGIYIVAAIFAMGCNWFSGFGIANPPARSNALPSEASKDNTQASQSTVEQNALTGTSRETVPSSIDQSASTAGTAGKAGTDSGAAVGGQETALTDAEVKATADAIVAELNQVRSGLNKKLSLSASRTAPLSVRDLVNSGGGSSAQQQTSLQGVVDGELVNIRSGPSTNHPISGQVDTGMILEITGRNEEGTWLRVCCLTAESGDGWIFGELLVLSPQGEGRLNSIPTVETAAAPAAGIGGSTAAAGASPAAQEVPSNGNFALSGEINPLTGLASAESLAGRRPIIVCINNDFAARPQFGTADADVMYEYLMEGYSITRFSGIYFGTPSAQVGPIRSARLVNYYMGALYDAGLVCSGASDPVRYTLKHESPFPYLDVDLDDPSNSRYTMSIGNDYRTRLRTDTGKLGRWLVEWGVQKPGSIRGFTFGPLSAGGSAASTITVPYPSSSRSSYQYDGQRGAYLRALGGTPHLDGNSNQQLALENVIIQYVVHETTDIVEDSLGSLSIRLNLFGSGRAIVFRDGQAIDGSWRSDSGGDLPRFFDTAGTEIALKPGRSWISILPNDYTVSYQ